MDIDRFYHVHVETIGFQLFLDLGDLFFLPDLAGLLVMQGPNDAGHAGDLLDVRQLDAVVALAVPAKAHLHRHK